MSNQGPLVPIVVGADVTHTTSPVALASGGPRRRQIDRAPLLSVDAIRKLHAERDAKKPKPNATNSSTDGSQNWSVSYHRQALSTASEGTPNILAAARSTLASAASPHSTMYQSPQRRRLAEAQLENERTSKELLELERQNRSLHAFDLSDISGSMTSNSSRTLAGPDTLSLEYLRTHSVVPLFNELLAELLEQKPENPVEYLIDSLRELQTEVSQARQQLERESVRQLAGKGRGKNTPTTIAASDDKTTPNVIPTDDRKPSDDGAIVQPVDAVQASSSHDHHQSATPKEAFDAVVKETADAGIPLVRSVLGSDNPSAATTGDNDDKEVNITTPEDVMVGEEGPATNTTLVEETASVGSQSERHRRGSNIVESSLLDGYSAEQLEGLYGDVPYLFLMTQSGSTITEGVTVSVKPVGIQLLLRSCIVPNIVRSSSLIMSNPMTPVATKRLTCLSVLAQCVENIDPSPLGIDLLIHAAGNAARVRPQNVESATISPKSANITLPSASIPFVNPRLDTNDVNDDSVEHDESVSPNPSRAEYTARGSILPPSTPSALEEEDEISSKGGNNVSRSSHRPPSAPTALHEEHHHTTTTNTTSTVSNTAAAATVAADGNTGYSGVDSVVMAAHVSGTTQQLHGLEMLATVCENVSRDNSRATSAKAKIRSHPTTPTEIEPDNSHLPVESSPQDVDQPNISKAAVNNNNTVDTGVAAYPALTLVLNIVEGEYSEPNSHLRCLLEADMSHHTNKESA